MRETARESTSVFPNMGLGGGTPCIIIFQNLVDYYSVDGLVVVGVGDGTQDTDDTGWGDIKITEALRWDMIH